METIKPGTYTLPEGCTCIKKGDTIEIRPSKRLPKCEHYCCECKWAMVGYCGNSLYKTNVCEKKPKNKLHYKSKEHLYYAVGLKNKACDMFKQK